MANLSTNMTIDYFQIQPQIQNSYYEFSKPKTILWIIITAQFMSRANDKKNHLIKWLLLHIVFYITKRRRALDPKSVSSTKVEKY